MSKSLNLSTCSRFGYFGVVRESLILPISFRISSLAFGQPYNDPSANEARNNNMHLWVNKSQEYAKNYGIANTNHSVIQPYA